MPTQETHITESGSAPASQSVPSTQQVKLADGWSGVVTVRGRGLAGETKSACDLPRVDEWKAWLSRLVCDPGNLPGHMHLKYSRHGEVFSARLDYGGGSLEVICKRSHCFGLRRLVAPFRPSRERRTYNRSLALIRAGINTPLPLALLERGALRREGWLVSEFGRDLVDLDQVVLRLLPRLGTGRSRKVKDAIIRALVTLFSRMEENHLWHRDMKASNVLIKDWDGQTAPPSVWIADLDGVDRRLFVSRRRSWQPVVRLGASLIGYSSVTRTDFTRFLWALLALRGGPRESWPAVFRALALRVNEYVRKSRQRKLDKLDGFDGER